MLLACIPQLFTIGIRSVRFIYSEHMSILPTNVSPKSKDSVILNYTRLVPAPRQLISCYYSLDFLHLLVTENELSETHTIKSL